MNEYYDRDGHPLKYGDAVAALRGDDENGYTATLYTVGYPDGHHTLMLMGCYSYANIYQHIPTSKHEVKRRRLTRLGPCSSVNMEVFERWRREIGQMAETDKNINWEEVRRLRPLYNLRYGRHC